MKKTKRLLVILSLFIGLALLSYFYQDIKTSLLGEYKQVQAQVIDTHRSAQNMGYYAQVVNYIFVFDGKLYEGSFTSSESIGLQGIGESIRVGFYSKFPKYSSLKRFNRGVRYYEHLRFRKYIHADTIGYAELRVRKKSFQLHEFGEKSRLNSIQMGTIRECNDSFVFTPVKIRKYHYKNGKDDPFKIEEELIQSMKVKDANLAMSFLRDKARNFVFAENGKDQVYKRIIRR